MALHLTWFISSVNLSKAQFPEGFTVLIPGFMSFLTQHDVNLGNYGPI